MKSGASGRCLRAVGLLLLLAAEPAFAVYRCPMPDGKTIFSDLPCDAIVIRNKKMGAVVPPSPAQQQAPAFQRPQVTTNAPASAPAPAPEAPVATPQAVEPAKSTPAENAAAQSLDSLIVREDTSAKAKALRMPLLYKALLIIVLMTAHAFLKIRWIATLAYAFALSAWHTAYLAPAGIRVGPEIAMGMIVFGLFASGLQALQEKEHKAYWAVFALSLPAILFI